MRRVFAYIFASEVRQVLYSECVFVALVIQCVMRMRLFVASPDLQYFSPLSHKLQD